MVNRIVLEASTRQVENGFVLPKSDDQSIDQFIEMSIGGGVAESIRSGEESTGSDADHIQVGQIVSRYRPHLRPDFATWSSQLLKWKSEVKSVLSRSEVWSAVDHAAQHMLALPPPAVIEGSGLRLLIASTCKKLGAA